MNQIDLKSPYKYLFNLVLYLKTQVIITTRVFKLYAINSFI